MHAAVDVLAVLDRLGSPPLTVAAGRAGAGRPVRRVLAVAGTGDLAGIQPGDLVVAPPAALRAGGDPAAGLRCADAGGAAAVVVVPDGTGPVPGDLAAVADQLALPLLTAAGRHPAAAVATALLHALVAAQAERLDQFATIPERFASVSLEQLVAGPPTAVAQVLERAAPFGWDLDRPRAVLLASIDPPGDGPIPPQALPTIAAAARASLGDGAIVWARTTMIAALLAPDTDGPAERRRIAEALRRELDVRLRSVNVSIGVGRRVPCPDLLPRSFAEAARAVDVGRWAKGRHVTEVFDQLGLERLLAAATEDDLAEFVEHAIGPLITHDEANHSELVDTLAVWLATRNMAEAARRLPVHYNTLKNRLERIEAIIGPVVSDPARSLECEIAIHLHRHHDVGRRPPG